MTTANQTRRSIMLTAWTFKRSEPARAFADCLRGAWKITKGVAKAAAKMFGRAARQGGLHGSIVRSASWDRLGSGLYRGAAFGSANSMISRVGR